MMDHALRRAWRRDLWRLGAWLGAAVVIGLWTHALIACLLVTTAAALALCLYRLWRLGAALEAAHRFAPEPPDATSDGVWSAIEHLIGRRQQAARSARHRLLHLLRAFRDAASALPDAVVVLDRDHRILWFNKAAQTLLKLDYPRDLGERITKRLPAPQISQWLADGGHQVLPDVPSPSDERAHLNLRRIAYTPDQSLLLARDVSQLVRLEQVRRDFVANVSHELRTPLTVVHGYLDLIEPEDFPDYEPILRELRNQSRRMADIVEDLLTLSRLEAGDELPDERIAMSPLLATLHREANALSQGRHTILVECDPHFDLFGSIKDLHSAFSNLVSNAVRYTPQGGTITIRWSAKAGGAQLAVVDTGPGIAAQHLPRLTERFYRISTSRSRESGGTGLGLSIVKHILQLHEAHLDIASQLGVGSTFSCRFGPERLIARAARAQDE